MGNTDIPVKAASYISLKATSSTIVMTREFAQFFTDADLKRRFFWEILSLFIDIYHRHGAGYIDKEGHLLGTARDIDERVGTVAGLAFAGIDKQEKKHDFMEGIDSDQCLEVFTDFHEWSTQFSAVNGSKSSLVVNFAERWGWKLNITGADMHKFSFYLDDLVRQYITDVRFGKILNIV